MSSRFSKTLKQKLQNFEKILKTCLLGITHTFMTNYTLVCYPSARMHIIYFLSKTDLPLINNHLPFDNMLLIFYLYRELHTLYIHILFHCLTRTRIHCSLHTRHIYDKLTHTIWILNIMLTYTFMKKSSSSVNHVFCIWHGNYWNVLNSHLALSQRVTHYGVVENCHMLKFSLCIEETGLLDFLVMIYFLVSDIRCGS